MGWHTRLYYGDFVNEITWPYVSLGKPNFVISLKSKMYGARDTSLVFSDAADVTEWDSAAPDSLAGFVDVSEELPGSQLLVTLAPYQNKLALFAADAVSIWQVDPDPAQNQALDNLPNFGTRSPRSPVRYGDIDLVFMDASGIRSLRARDSSNLPGVNDLGAPIDRLVTAWMATLSERQRKNNVHGVVEPREGRLWMICGNIAYVYTFFAGSKVSAWSTYTLPGLVDDAAVHNNTVLLRCGDQIYAYGIPGDPAPVYDGTKVSVLLPYLDAEDPATPKTWYGLDLGIEGEWTVSINTTPNYPDAFEPVGTFDQVTYPMAANTLVANATHLQLQLESETEGVVRLSNVAVHFTKDAEE